MTLRIIHIVCGRGALMPSTHTPLPGTCSLSGSAFMASCALRPQLRIRHTILTFNLLLGSGWHTGPSYWHIPAGPQTLVKAMVAWAITIWWCIFLPATALLHLWLGQLSAASFLSAWWVSVPYPVSMVVGGRPEQCSKLLQIKLLLEADASTGWKTVKTPVEQENPSSLEKISHNTSQLFLYSGLPKCKNNNTGNARSCLKALTLGSRNWQFVLTTKK